MTPRDWMLWVDGWNEQHDKGVKPVTADEYAALVAKYG